MKNITDPYGIRNIQERSLSILKFLDKVCRQNGLTYYLAYGTLLGAVRHEGFIPWDDDVDVWMTREDYMKLLSYLRENNTDERFVLNEGPHKPKGDRPSEFQMRILDLDGTLSRTYAGTTIQAHPWIDFLHLTVSHMTKRKNILSGLSVRYYSTRSRDARIF